MTNLLSGLKSGWSSGYAYWWITTFLIVVFGSYLLTKFGPRVGFTDDPTSSNRKIHIRSKPLGGLALFLGFLPVYWAVAEDPLPLTIGLIIVFSTGIIDDIWKLGARAKLLLQVIAGVLFVWLLPIPETILQLSPGLAVAPPAAVNYPLIVFWAIGGTNAINLIDGLDGLATGIGVITLIPLFLFTPSGEASLLIGLALASLVGFSLFNFYPAKLFLGDEGSYFIGFLVSYCVIAGLSYSSEPASTVQWNLLAGILLFGIPVVDTTWAIVRRFRTEQGIMQADRSHFHHRLFARFGHLRAVLIIYGFQAVSAALAVFLFLAR